MLMLMHVGCGTMKCGSTTALVMAVGFLIYQKTSQNYKLKCKYIKYMVVLQALKLQYHEVWSNYVTVKYEYH